MVLVSAFAFCVAILFLILHNYKMIGALVERLWGRQEDSVVDSQRKDESNENVQSDGSIQDVEDGETTPRAQATRPLQDVPVLKLEGQESHASEADASRTNVPQFPAIGSAQRASTAAPSARTFNKANQISSSSMPPPPPKPSVSLGLKPSATSSLRIPSSGPLPNRGPPANSQQRASAGLSVSGAVPVPNPRGKVLLSPGHSPMDWAALTRSGNISGVATFQRVTPSQLRTMTGRKGKPAWSSWQGKVYNITPYLPFHPGGEAELMKAAGRDGTKLFMDVHPWVNWENMLSATVVGVMVPEDYGQSPLEDMD